MKLLRFSVLAAIVCTISAMVSGCVQEELPDNRETSYGYVQFKLYKAASYEPASKALVEQLDYLSDASKVKVDLIRDEQTISQTLTLTAADDASAEFGLRSSKLKILHGDYQVASFTLYDKLDQELYRGSASEILTVVAGGLTMYDLTANAVERGFVRFHLKKDLSAFTQTPDVKSSTVSRQYTFDEIDKIDITVRADDGTGKETEFTGLPVIYAEHFADEDIDGNHVDTDKGSGYRTSSIVCDTLVSLVGGNYQVVSYKVWDENSTLLETNVLEGDAITSFSVSDNATTQADVKVSLYEADEYIKDNYALYAIWKALDGEHWSYEGESYVKGCNWDFNKDPDLWSAQPGVEVHSNGRIAKLNLSGFGIKGKVPEQIGQLTELVELFLGDHSEIKNYDEDPIQWNAGIEDKEAIRLRRYEAYRDGIHPAIQMSAPCALALREHNISINAISMYESLSDDELAAMAAGQRQMMSDPEISLMDVTPGKFTNGLTGFDPAIGKLTKLEYLYIGNAPITLKDEDGNDNFPAEFANMTSLTDFELYNCPNLTELPDAIANLPSLISVNLSATGFGKGDDSDENSSYQALKKLAEGKSKNTIQILYYNRNNLRKLPVESLAAMSKLGRLDVSYNSIHGIIPAFGESFSPVDLYFDHNLIEGFENSGKKFCKTEDFENFSANYNKLTEFPNIFTSDTDYYLSSISVGYNDISSFPSNFNGLKVETLTLSANDFESFPKELGTSNSSVNYILLNGCGMSEFPEGCFGGKYSSALVSFDLTYNDLTSLPKDFSAEYLPYLYGVDMSYNDFSAFPYEPLDCLKLTVYGLRGQRDKNGDRCMKQWPTGIYQHTGVRGLFLGSNDLRKIDDTISNLIYYLDISDNPNITFDAADICYYWQAGAYILYYDRTQDIRNCDAMLE